MLNHIVIMGRLTRDPELRYTRSEKPVANFTLAVDRDSIDRNTNQREADFVDVVAWNATAEFVSRYFSKGSMAVVSGRLQIKEWTDRDGNKRKSAEIMASNVYFGEAKAKESGPRPAGRPVDVSAEDYDTRNPFAELDDDDGELPY